MDAKGEAAHQKRDRCWRRWEAFVREWGLGNDSLLDSVSSHSEKLLLARGFVMHHRTFDFNGSGEATHRREKPMVSATVRDAIGNVAASFRERDRASPFHVTDGINGTQPLHPKIKCLLTAFDSQDPPTRKQKAVTPQLLRDLTRLWAFAPTGTRHTANLIIGAYFFAMRACEFCTTETPGITRKLTADNVVFRGLNNKVIPHDDKDLIQKSEFVTMCFANQKNGTKMEKRSQRKTGDADLCPVRAWGRVIKQLVTDFPSEDERHSSHVCRYRDHGTIKEVTATDVKSLLRRTCLLGDGERRYGVKPEELGTRSIRSGAAMALAIQGGHSDNKIMLLGRWRSSAFLKYIRPQTMEWAGSTSKEMARTPAFLDLEGDTDPRIQNTQSRKEKQDKPTSTSLKNG
jgi:hypothetical protein